MNRKNNIITAIIIVVIALIVVLTAKTVITSASDLHSEKPVCYKSVEIEAEDTLWGISEEYAAKYHTSIQNYVKVLKELNGLSGDKIVSGSHLLVAYYAD